MVVDLKMPKLNGISLIKLLQNRGLNPPRIFLITGTEIEKGSRQVEVLGVEAVLSKPVNEESLIRALFGKVERSVMRLTAFRKTL